MEHNSNFFNQHCLSLTRFAVILLIGVMFTCSDDNAPLDMKPPDVPTGFSVLSISNDRVVLTWDEMENITHYFLSKTNADFNIRVLGDSYTATNLDASTPYYFFLKACNSGGCSPRTNLIFTTTPSVPKLRVERVTSYTISLSWDISDGATHYVIDTGSIQITNQGGGKTFFTIPDLEAATPYTLRVRACDGYRCSPEASIDVTTAPAVPNNLAVGEVTSYTISLSWDISDGATHYVVDTGSIQITNQGRENTSSTIPGLEAETRYTLRVRACDGYRCSPEASIDVTTALTTPMNFTAKNITSAGVTLEWDAVTGAGEYIIYREKTPIATNTALTHTVVNLRFSTSYSFFVRACNSQSCSDLVLKQVTTLEAPDSFSIAYPDMESANPDTSSPVFVSSENCNILDYTLGGKARYGLGRNTIGSDEPVLPTIDPITGVVNNNGAASPGAYRVTVKVPENVDCNTNVLVYNTVTPADKSALQITIDSGIGFHGDTGNFNYIITSQVTDMSGLFEDKNDFNGDITEWDTSQVQNMSEMFSNAVIFNQPLSNWDTSKVKDMSRMFGSAESFNQPLSNWNTSNVEDMSGMFALTYEFNQPTGDWDTSQVTNMSEMFAGAVIFNQPLSNWDTSKVEDMSKMFHFAFKFNQPLSNWDTSQVKNMDYMFAETRIFNQPLSNWDTSQVEVMRGMFRYNYEFNQPLSNWNTSNVEDMSEMFAGARVFDQPLSNWDTSQVTNMSDMFRESSSFNQPLSNWDTSKVEDMDRMFWGASVFDQDLSGWVVINVREHNEMFHSSPMRYKTEKHPKWR